MKNDWKNRLCALIGLPEPDRSFLSKLWTGFVSWAVRSQIQRSQRFSLFYFVYASFPFTVHPRFFNSWILDPWLWWYLGVIESGPFDSSDGPDSSSLSPFLFFLFFTTFPLFTPLFLLLTHFFLLKISLKNFKKNIVICFNCYLFFFLLYLHCCIFILHHLMHILILVINFNCHYF